MTDLTQGTWILVADGEKALFLENMTDDADPYFKVRREVAQENPADRDQTSDRAGRRADGGAGQRSAMEEADWHMLAKDRFAADLSEILLRLVQRGAFERLVVVAPARTLGALRAGLHKEVAGRVVAEIGKDLTNHPLTDIEQSVRAALHAS